MTNIEKMIEDGMNASAIEHAWCKQFHSCKECPFKEYHDDCVELINIYKWLLQEVID